MEYMVTLNYPPIFGYLDIIIGIYIDIGVSVVVGIGFFIVIIFPN